MWGIPVAFIFGGAVLGRELNFGPLRRPIKALGDASYALYLLHSLMLAVVLSGWQLGLNRFPLMTVIYSAVVAVQLISVAVYFGFEKRIYKFLQQALANWLDLRSRAASRPNRFSVPGDARDGLLDAAIADGRTKGP
jgi:exopolysaccharide production protein ExoZ